MESQQIVELLLAMQQEMNANADAKARTEAENKAWRERMDANRQADQELLIGIMDANAKSMREDIKSGEEKMEAAIHLIRSELEETIQSEMKGFLSYVDQKTQMKLQTADVLYGIPADTTYEKTDHDPE
jgi:hypothetical protein